LAQTLSPTTYSDLAALEYRRVTVGIAMGNSSKEVQAEANFVTDSNEEEGFANAIERFVLN
jgi:hypothetical protein